MPEQCKWHESITFFQKMKRVVGVVGSRNVQIQWKSAAYSARSANQIVLQNCSSGDQTWQIWSFLAKNGTITLKPEVGLLRISWWKPLFELWSLGSSLRSKFWAWSNSDIYFSEGPRFHCQIHTLPVLKNVFSNEVAWLPITNGLLAFTLSFSIRIPMPPVQKHKYNKPIEFSWNLWFFACIGFSEPGTRHFERHHGRR